MVMGFQKLSASFAVIGHSAPTASCSKKLTIKNKCHRPIPEIPSQLPLFGAREAFPLSEVLWWNNIVSMCCSPPFAGGIRKEAANWADR